MNTQSTACRAATKAQTKAATPRIVAIGRTETVISTRFGGGSGTLERSESRNAIGGCRRAAARLFGVSRRPVQPG